MTDIPLKVMTLKQYGFILVQFNRQKINIVPLLSLVWFLEWQATNVRLLLDIFFMPDL